MQTGAEPAISSRHHSYEVYNEVFKNFGLGRLVGPTRSMSRFLWDLNFSRYNILI